MWDKPVESAKKKPNNSMAVGVRLVKEGKGDAFVTAGNTGGAMFNALRVLGRINGVQRPALTAIFPTKKGRCIVVDIGANADCRPEFLQQFAILGSIYAQNVLGNLNPRIGLLSNGEEAGKGNQLVKDAFQLLSKSKINFIGNVEPKELFGGEADVVITDGFTGNVLVKTSEAVAKMITDVLKEELMGTFRTKIGAVLAKPAFSKMKSLIDPSEIGAAPLLGIDGLVFVGHGRSDARAIVSSLLLADRAIKSGLMTEIRNKVSDCLSALPEDK
jgi:glycerol-3-phosphate acyltransferase PlsX